MRDTYEGVASGSLFIPEAQTVILVSPKVARAIHHMMRLGGTLPCLHRDHVRRGGTQTLYVRLPTEEVPEDDWTRFSLLAF